MPASALELSYLTGGLTWQADYMAELAADEKNLALSAWVITAATLGLPLPAGVVRVYQRDTSGGLQFVGEDRIDHTPENETA